MKKRMVFYYLYMVISLMIFLNLPIQSAETINIEPINGISPDFIKGADVSMLKQIEICGGKFYDEGIEKDCLQILKDHGINWIRLRLWNNPKDAEGHDLGGGNCDEAKIIEIAKRAKTIGLKFLLDFHYSDFWADPGKQTKPDEWKNLSMEQLQKAIYDYTAKIIKDLNNEGATPDMVQIGNETNSGFLWPEGLTYDGWAILAKQAIKAVHDNDSNSNDPNKKIKVMIHLSNGGDNKLYRRVFDELIQRDVDFDVIGLSFYPYWHGTLEELQYNMNDISERYQKDVVVAECAYAYTFENGDDLANIFGPNEEIAGGYKVSVQGQAQAVRDIMEAVAKVPKGRGRGVFYWEPDWIPVAGAGWKAGEGNAWENQAMFDFEGNVLPSLDVFALVSGPGTKERPAPAIAAIRPVELKVSLGEEPQLPATVKAEYDDARIKDVPVAWDQIKPEDLERPGKIVVTGEVKGTSLRALATIVVEGKKNYAKNPGFETGDFSGWTVTGDKAYDCEKSSAPGGNAHGGDYSLHYWADKPFKFTIYQTITGLKNGRYTLSVWTHGGGGEKSLRLFAADYGGETLAVEIVNTKWHEWKNPTIENIEVTNGQCTIGLIVDAEAGNWGNFDDVEFCLQSE